MYFLLKNMNTCLWLVRTNKRRILLHNSHMSYASATIQLYPVLCYAAWYYEDNISTDFKIMHWLENLHHNGFNKETLQDSAWKWCLSFMLPSCKRKISPKWQFLKCWQSPRSDVENEAAFLKKTLRLLLLKNDIAESFLNLP